MRGSTVATRQSQSSYESSLGNCCRMQIVRASATSATTNSNTGVPSVCVTASAALPTPAAGQLHNDRRRRYGLHKLPR
jgi:hypothetical protein